MTVAVRLWSHTRLGKSLRRTMREIADAEERTVASRTANPDDRPDIKDAVQTVR